MSGTEISNRINLIHVSKLNRLMLKIFAVAFILSVLQDLFLHFVFKQITFSLLLINPLFMISLCLPSYLLYKRNYNPRLLGVYNVFVCVSYIAFTLINYNFSPSSLLFISFNIIVASIYFDLKGYVFVSVFSLAEVILFSYMPAYAPQGDFWLEVSNRLQVILFVSLFCYGVLRPSQLLIGQVMEQEVLAMQMAHELRNPLTTVKGFLQLLGKRNMVKDVPFELVLDELDRANSIITDYLTLYKPLTKNSDHCDINKIILGVVELMDIQANRQDIIIEKQLALDLPFLNLDVNQIKQVFVNLVKNSMQAIGAGGKISIYSCLDKINGSIIITIQDTGPGFPSDMIKRDFALFYTTKQDGNGLGLPVCKKIIDNHGGNLEIGNLPVKGSYVSISLPVNLETRTA